MALRRSLIFVLLVCPVFAFAASQRECISKYTTSTQDIDGTEVDCNEGSDLTRVEEDPEFQSQLGEQDTSYHFAVQCGEDAFIITLPAGPLSGVRILGSKKTLPVVEASESCGFSLKRGKTQNTLTVRFSGCLVGFQEGQYHLRVSYVNEAGMLDISDASCPDYSEDLSPSDGHPEPRGPQTLKLAPPDRVRQNPATSLVCGLSDGCVGLEGVEEKVSEHPDFDDISDKVTFKHHNLDVEELYNRDGKAVVQLAEVTGVQSELALPAVTNVSVSNAVPVSLVVLCSEDEFKVMLPVGPLSEVKILGPNNTLSVVEAPESCGYSLSQGENYNSLTVRFSGCLVRLQAGRLTLRISYVNERGILDVSNISCQRAPKSPLYSPSPLVPPAVLNPRSPPASELPDPNAVPRSRFENPLSTSSGCYIPRSQQVPCGYRYSRISSSRCLAMGCCVDSTTSACFYPMDECTADKHFVFVIHRDIATFPVDPTNLMVVGKSNCGPVIVNNKFAIFKFSVTRCGTHSYEIGGTMIYTAEVQTAVRTLNLKYGVISRDNLLRIMVECRYPREVLGSWPVIVRLGYMVKSPSLSSYSTVKSKGQFGVQLRIAQDGRYETFLEQYHQPLQLLLGKPVYLEVRLFSPRPEATLLVNYCLAYPRSAKKALVLIHEGCANPLDPNVSILKFHNLRQNRHRRRFMVQAFQFMDQHSNKYLTEEIYFMCSTEVCMPTERTCKQRCFDGKV
ncbi:hypothetical protein DPEC_G00344590 [Dallia pectoralis]|uniref:Uncharacterized protein n=1 Tax=Dallia pectoralis TaxID=75939 RepID=A0ACC2F3B2_DALPE|nr:hypothetical protein DPEC_G00344590 [Dallia pectoralis]